MQCFFDTRMIDFEGKRGRGEFQFWNTSEDISDMLTTSYDEATGAMRLLTQHLLPIMPKINDTPAPPRVDEDSHEITAMPSVDASIPTPTPESKVPVDGDAPPTQDPTSTVPVVDSAPTYDWSNVDFNVVEEASKSPLDGAIAAAIAMAGTENKIKAAGMSILLIGGTSALKGLGAFVSERSVSRSFSH